MTGSRCEVIQQWLKRSERWNPREGEVVGFLSLLLLDPAEFFGYVLGSSRILNIQRFFTSWSWQNMCCSSLARLYCTWLYSTQLYRSNRFCTVLFCSTISPLFVFAHSSLRPALPHFFLRLSTLHCLFYSLLFSHPLILSSFLLFFIFCSSLPYCAFVSSSLLLSSGLRFPLLVPSHLFFSPLCSILLS